MSLFWHAGGPSTVWRLEARRYITLPTVLPQYELSLIRQPRSIILFYYSMLYMMHFIFSNWNS